MEPDVDLPRELDFSKNAPKRPSRLSRYSASVDILDEMKEWPAAKKIEDDVTTSSSRSSLTSLLTSATAGTSRSKKSRSTVSSRASTLLRFPSFSSRSRTNSDISALPPDAPICAGDSCETISRVTVRVSEALESDLVTELNTGTIVRVVEMGVIPRRAKIEVGSVSGWISIRTKENFPLLVKRTEDHITSFEVGGRHQVLNFVTMREGEDIESDIISELPISTTVRIIEIGSNPRRAKVTTIDHGTGWISVSTSRGDVLVGQIHDPIERRRSLVGTSEEKIKTFLELARRGDVQAMKKACIGGVFGRSRVDAGCFDIRGRTALMYGAACGHVEVVDYLIFQQTGVDVNATDDTQKIALHYATRRTARSPRQAGADRQHEVVQALLDGRAWLEARDHQRCTPLMFAAASGEKTVTLTLLRAGTDVHLEDFEGSTALDYAAKNGHDSVVQELIEAGARCKRVIDDETVSALGKRQSVPSQSTSSFSSTREDLAKDMLIPSGFSPCARTGDVEPNAALVVPEYRTVSLEPNLQEATASSVDTKLRPRSRSYSNAQVKSKKRASIPQNPPPDSGMEQVEAAKPGRRSTVRLRPKGKVKAKRKTSQEPLADQDAGDNGSEGDRPETRDKANPSGISKGDRVVALVDGPTWTPQPLLKGDRGWVKALEDADGQFYIEFNGVSGFLYRSEFELIQDDAEHVQAAIAKTSSISRDVEDSMKVATAGVDGQLVHEAHDKLKSLAARALVLEQLNCCSVETLSDLITEAEKAGVGKADIEKAKGRLSLEMQLDLHKKKAREMLEEALHSRSVAKLRIAIGWAQKAKLPSVEISAYEDALRKLGAKEKAIEDLRVAMDSKDVCLLGSAILMARELDVDEDTINSAVMMFCIADVEAARRVDGITASSSDKGFNNFLAFDAVFMPGTQEGIFADCQDLVRSAFDGYNVTIFAYGNAGAGKSYAIGGTRSSPSLSRQTINEVFSVADSMTSRCHCSVSGSVLELHRQDMRDLLAVSRNYRGRSISTISKSRPSTNPMLSKMRDDPMRLQNRSEGAESLSEKECRNADELSQVLDEAMQARMSLSSVMNPDSSRSHVFFSIKVITVNKETRDKMEGKIMIVDLAGSDTLSKSQGVGEEVKESIEINKSLTALGDVIAVATKGSKQIPYRSHKLAAIMQDAIGASAKTLMFVNCSPARPSIEETNGTMVSLKYASRGAKKITNSHSKQRKA